MRHNIDVLCGRLWYHGASIVAMSGRIGAPDNLREGHLDEVEKAAHEVLSAVAAFRAAKARAEDTLPMARLDKLNEAAE